VDKVSLYLPRETRHAIDDIARRNGRSRSDFVREALAEFIERQGRPLPKSIGMFSNSDVTSETIEDWLEADWQRDW